MTERRHARTGREERAADHRAQPVRGAAPAGLAGLRALPPGAQLRAAVGLQGVTGDIGDIDANDVKQGLLGDCNLLAPAAAVACANPEAIRRLISKNAGGSYDVNLYYENFPWSDATAHTFRVTSQFYTDKGGSPVYAKHGDTGPAGPELWVMLIEKAFARFRGSYSAADGALWDREALEMLTGNSASEDDVDDGTEAELLTKMNDALKAKQAITVNTSTSRWKNWRRSSEEEAEITKHNIKLGHAYSIEAVDAGAKTVNLRNPWGFAHLTNLPVSVLRKYFHTWSRVSTR